MGLPAIVGLDVSVFEGVLAVGDVDARTALARQLGALICDPATPDIEIQQATPVLLRMTLDREKQVRRALAEELHLDGRISADVAFAVVADEDEIALPFLMRTQALNAALLLAILKIGDEPRQAVIAARPDLSAEAAAYIIKSGSLGAAIALFDNSVVTLEPADCRTLYNRFGQSQEIVERLLKRRDLPLDVRITQARRAAQRMRQMMAERSWMPANDAVEMCSEAEDNALMQVLIDATADERASAMTFLATKNLLTPALILRAAAIGQMSVVEAALAHLLGNSQRRTALLMYASGTSSLKSLFRRSGLPQSCYGIIRAACDVVIDMGEEGLEITSSDFGARMLEALMTRYESMDSAERTKQIEYLGRYGEDKIRKVAKRLKADLVRAA